MTRRNSDTPAGTLPELDPLRVPLPNGTEVATRLDRLVDGRVVPQGAVGRVLAQADGAFDVQLVGVGVVRFTRDELRPRKAGQARYAQGVGDKRRMLRRPAGCGKCPVAPGSDRHQLVTSVRQRVERRLSGSWGANHPDERLPA